MDKNTDTIWLTPYTYFDDIGNEVPNIEYDTQSDEDRLLQELDSTHTMG